MNKHDETKPLTVAELATKADTQHDNDIVRIAESLKDMIPGIMHFPIVKQTFKTIIKQP